MSRYMCKIRCPLLTILNHLAHHILFVTPQVLQFESYKTYGPILLAGGYTHSLLEELDHAQAQLAVMLMSPHIQPLRDDTAQWAAKLSNIGEVLLQVRDTTVFFLEETSCRGCGISDGVGRDLWEDQRGKGMRGLYFHAELLFPFLPLPFPLPLCSHYFLKNCSG